MNPAETPYALMGGEEAVRALVERFYDLMELDPQFRQLRAVHGSSLESAREKLFMLRAMEETEVPQGLRPFLGDALRKTADWMRNR